MSAANLAIALTYAALAIVAAAAAWSTGVRGYRALAALALLAWAMENVWTVSLGWDRAPALIAATDLGIAVATTRVALWSGLWTPCRLIVGAYALRFVVQVVAALGPEAGRYGYVFYAALNLLYAASLAVLFGGAVLERRAARLDDRPWPVPHRTDGGVALGPVARDAGADQS